MASRQRAYSSTIKACVEAFCKALGMFTENQVALHEGDEPPYRMEDFEALIHDFNSVDRPL